jgi:hypothetical protein
MAKGHYLTILSGVGNSVLHICEDVSVQGEWMLVASTKIYGADSHLDETTTRQTSELSRPVDPSLFISYQDFIGARLYLIFPILYGKSGEPL